MPCRREKMGFPRHCRAQPILHCAEGGMSEVGDLVKMLGSPLGLIGTIALAAGGLAHHFATAELKNAAGRDRLRTALQAGGYWRRLYIHLLTPALDRLDRFLGDADKAAFSLPSPFGNREAHPYWTGWSFDRCALLALVYPLLSLFFVWVWTGESGPIAEWLGMKHGAPGWYRAVSAMYIVVIIFAVQQSQRTSGRHALLWAVLAFAFAGVGTVAVVSAFVSAGAGAVVGVVAFVSGFTGANAGVVAFIGAVAFIGTFAIV